jgi:hypothetical protein
MAKRYRLLDEPSPSPWSNIVVHPLWPLLGLMLGGFWLAVPWFIVNSIALGSSSRIREAVIAISGLLVTSGVVVMIVMGASRGWLEGATLAYAGLTDELIKLATAYILYSLQSRSVAIHEHYGGTVRNGLPVVLLAAILGRRLVLSAIPWQLVRIILA